MKKGKGFNLMSVVIIICITSLISAITAGIIVTNNYDLSYKGLSTDKNLNEFLKAYSNIVNNYYEDIDKEKMLDAAMDAMLNYLGDNYTTYLTKEQRKELEERFSVQVENKTPLEIMEEIAERRKYVVRGGEIDYERTAKAILDDFRKGRIGKITL